MISNLTLDDDLLTCDHQGAEELVKAALVLLVELDDVPQLPLDVLHVDPGVVQDPRHHQAGVEAPCEVGHQAQAESGGLHSLAAQTLSVTQDSPGPKTTERLNFNLGVDSRAERLARKDKLFVMKWKWFFFT